MQIRLHGWQNRVNWLQEKLTQECNWEREVKCTTKIGEFYEDWCNRDEEEHDISLWLRRDEA